MSGQLFTYTAGPPGWTRTSTFQISPKLSDPACKVDSFKYSPPVGEYTIHSNLMRPSVSKTRSETWPRKMRVSAPMLGAHAKASMDGGLKLHYPAEPGSGDYELGGVAFKRAQRDHPHIQHHGHLTNQFRSRTSLFWQERPRMGEGRQGRRGTRSLSAPMMSSASQKDTAGLSMARTFPRKQLFKVWSQQSPEKCIRLAQAERARDEQISSSWAEKIADVSDSAHTRAFGGKYHVEPPQRHLRRRARQPQTQTSSTTEDLAHLRALQEPPFEESDDLW